MTITLQSLMSWRIILATDGLTDDEIAEANDEIDALTAKRGLLDAEIDDLDRTKRTTQPLMPRPRAELETLEAILGAQSTYQRSLLEAAANKPVDDRIEAAVRSLLGF